MKKLTIGSAVYDDYEGVYFSYQSLRLNNLDIDDDLDYVIIDNNPSSVEGQAVKKFCEDSRKIRYFSFEEKTSNSDVKEFCEVNFNINFPLTTITEVKGENAHELFKWAKDNYGKSAVPKWNFHKILIDKNGNVNDTFASFTNPMSKKIIKKIENIL
mgnify:CR=1 FL=1